jgi:hypothetical protein
MSQFSLAVTAVCTNLLRHNGYFIHVRSSAQPQLCFCEGLPGGRQQEGVLGTRLRGLHGLVSIGNLG